MTGSFFFCATCLTKKLRKTLFSFSPYVPPPAAFDGAVKNWTKAETLIHRSPSALTLRPHSNHSGWSRAPQTNRERLLTAHMSAAFGWNLTSPRLTYSSEQKPSSEHLCFYVSSCFEVCIHVRNAVEMLIIYILFNTVIITVMGRCFIMLKENTYELQRNYSVSYITQKFKT